MACAACTRSPSEGAAKEPVPRTYYSSPANVCALLTKGDIEGTLGFKVRDGADIFIPTIFPFAYLPGIVKCVYIPQERISVNRPLFVTGIIWAYVDDVFRDVRSYVKRTGTLKIVGGIGKEAIWYAAGNDLYVLTDTKILGVHMSATGGEPDADLTERARRIAAAMIARLQ